MKLSFALAAALALVALPGCSTPSTPIPGLPQGIVDRLNAPLLDNSAGHGLLGTPKGSDDSDDNSNTPSTLPSRKDNK